VNIPESKSYWIGAQSNDPKGRNYDEEAYDWETLREVNLAPFRIGKYPVTVAQYQRFVEEGSTSDREPADWQEQQEHPNWPVVHVTWYQADAYCKWAGGRLPTEEEWERSARGPNGMKYPWGKDDIDPSLANYNGSKVGHATPVGLYPCGVSAEGLLDMVGNVWEWTSSEWSKGSGTYVWRGGAFYDFREVGGSRARRFATTAVRTYSSLAWGSGWPGESLEFFLFLLLRGRSPRGNFFGRMQRAEPWLLESFLERSRNVWRGGAFNNNRRNARSSYRNNNQPDEQNQNLGFRVAGGCGTGSRA
jgi:formylglycine-generating enzyme required for sulfatase activity